MIGWTWQRAIWPLLLATLMGTAGSALFLGGVAVTHRIDEAEYARAESMCLTEADRLIAAAAEDCTTAEVALVNSERDDCEDRIASAVKQSVMVRPRADGSSP